MDTSRRLVNLDVKHRLISPAIVGLRVLYQNPRVEPALPFTAADGTVVTVARDGVPFLKQATPDSPLTVGLRGSRCPLSVWNREIICSVPDAQVAARRTSAAVSELRDLLNRKTKTT